LVEVAGEPELEPVDANDDVAGNEEPAEPEHPAR
jgi:hypothetical protein